MKCCGLCWVNQVVSGLELGALDTGSHVVVLLRMRSVHMEVTPERKPVVHVYVTCGAAAWKGWHVDTPVRAVAPCSLQGVCLQRFLPYSLRRDLQGKGHPW